MKIAPQHLCLVLTFLAVWALGGVGHCAAEATLIQEIDPPAIHLGDTAKIIITVKDGGWTRLWLLQLPNVQDATIIHLGREDVEGTAEHPVVIGRFAMMPSRTGTFTIPGFDIRTQTSEVLHVQPMALQVFDVGQSIPQKYLTEEKRTAQVDVQKSPPVVDDSLTVLSATTGQPIQVIHFDANGKPLAPLELPTTNIAASVNAPQNPVSSTPSAKTVPDAGAVPSAFVPPINSTVIFTENSDLVSVKNAAKAGNPSAECQLAIRIRTARTPAATKLLNDEADDFLQYYNSHKEVLGWIDDPVHGGKSPLDLTKIDETNANDFVNTPTAPVVQEFLAKKRALQSMLDTVNKQEMKEASDLLQDSASKNNRDAFVALSRLYYDGGRSDVKAGFFTFSSQAWLTDQTKAFELASHAAKLGSAEGMLIVGIDYAKGDGVAKNISASVEWFRKSADQGNLVSYSLLSKIYSDGGFNGHDDGYAKNPAQAYIMGRALDEVSSPGTDEKRWASEDVAKARPLLSAEDLLTAEAKVPDEVLRLKSVAQLSSPLTPRPAKAGDMTKAEWRSHVPPLINGYQFLCNKGQVFAAVGDPVRTQTVGDDLYLYWKCRDGQIQVVCSQVRYGFGIIEGQINDY
jgi:TPR repeat protein